MHGLNGSSTPMDPNLTLEPLPVRYKAADAHKQRYKSSVRSLIYLIFGTRPDIAFAVLQVLRFSANPTDAYWIAVQRIFRYLKKQPNLGLVYRTEGLLGYTDAN